MDDSRSILVAQTDDKARAMAVELLAATADKAVARHGQFTLALAGGTTPKPLYELLASPAQADSFPWQDTQIFFGDERDVRLAELGRDVTTSYRRSRPAAR